MPQSTLPTRQGDYPFSAFRHEMNRLFDEAFNHIPLWRRNGDGALSPSIDLKETDTTFEVQAELPGVDQKDIDVSYAKGVLTIKGEKKAEKEESKGGYHLSERSYGSFVRSFAIDDVDADKVDAKFEKGVLKVVLPKLPASQAKTRKIEVKSA